MLVEVARIDSFIATLGTGTVIYAVALWYTGGRQVIGALPPSFFLLNSASLWGIPITAFYVLAIAVLLWIAAEYLPIGRYLYAIGANPRAAELNGIPTRRYVIGAFMASGAITAFAGVVLAARLRIGQASVGLEFLLPALVGAFLGSTTIKPGRVNVWGTIVGVAILAVGISGIQQFGGAFWVEPMFNGVTLLIAIGFAGWTGRRRGRAIVGSAAKRPHQGPQATKTGELNDATASTLLAAAGARRRCARRPGRRLPRPGQGHGAGRDRPSGKWDGPTTGPGREPGKNVVYVAGDLRNGGPGRRQWLPEAAGDRLERPRDRRPGQRPGIDSAFGQAMALKPDGIIIGGFDILQNMAKIEDADKQGIKVVAWHGGPRPGPVEGTAVLFNVTTDSDKVAEVAAMYAIAKSDGKAGVVVFTDSAYAIAIKSRRHGGGDQAVRRLHRALVRGHASGRHREPHA